MKPKLVFFNKARLYFASEPYKWSLFSFLDNVKCCAKNLLGLCNKVPGDFKCTFKYRPSSSYSYCVTREIPSVAVRRNYGIFRPSFWRKTTANWSANSLASNAKRSVYKGCGVTALALTGIALKSNPTLLSEEQKFEGLAYEIRDAFSKLSTCKAEDQKKKTFATSVNNLEIGTFLAKGCNAAVYSARWKDENNDTKEPPEDVKASEEASNEVVISHSDIDELNETTTTDAHALSVVPSFSAVSGSLEPYNLAVKMMFNYRAASDALTIWRAMYKETLPIIHDPPFYGKLNHVRKKKIPPHPNIVEMYCAFSDMMPLLPRAVSTYPHALPARLAKEGFGRNMTLFLVMKRYHCTLKEYLKSHHPSNKTSVLLLCQMLEGLVHLQQHGFAHRDLKTDNILCDLTDGISLPRLAITDFGNCLENLKLAYHTEEVDRGGNMALMPPEVSAAEAGIFSTIDYSRSDLWAVGTIAYELFGSENPFYKSDINSLIYVDSDLPPFPSKAPYVIKKLIKQILRKNPKERPSPSFAATVCQLLLHAPPDLLFEPFTRKSYRRAVDWLFIMSAATFLQALFEPIQKHSLQFQLRYVFCRRLVFTETLSALNYISQALQEE